MYGVGGVGMYRLVSWHKWQNTLLCVLVAALVAFGIGETVVTERRAVAASAAQGEGTVFLPIIMYHGVLDDSARQGQYIISPAMLESDLAYIRAQGYETVVVQDLIDYVDNGTPLPEKPIMLTFDDGYYNNYLYAYPLLQKYGMKAVISPVCKWTEFYSDTPSESDHAIYSHITWQEMRQMVDSGLVEIQNHSYDMHYCVAGKRKGTLKRAAETVEQYQNALREDLSTAQTHLTELVGVTPTAFTYPYGAMCDEALPIIEELGFRATLTCESRVNRVTRQADSLMGLGRYLRPDGTDSAAYFDRIFAAVDKAKT